MRLYYYLMHENIPVAAFITDGINIQEIGVVRNENSLLHLPLLDKSKGIDTKTALKKWIQNRGVPVTRQRIKVDLMNKNQTTFEYMLANLGLSLTDHYWLKPKDSAYTWESINLYENDFKSVYSLDLRDDLASIAGKTNFIPSASLKGDLKKKWIIDQYGTRMLVKGNYGHNCRQSLCEVLATEIHRRQGIFPYTPYSNIEISSDNQKIIGCMCPNFTSIDTEFIPAIDIVQSIIKQPNKNYYETYIEFCELNGIDKDYIRKFMDYQILTDFIITNTDRHFNNFGLIRDSKSLKFLGPAPIFDSGNSMFYNTSSIKVDYGLLNIQVTSFREHEVKLLELVQNSTILNVDLLPTDREVRELFSIDKTTSEEIINKLVRAYNRKIEFLREFQQGTKIYSYNYLKSHNIKLTKGE